MSVRIYRPNILRLSTFTYMSTSTVTGVGETPVSSCCVAGVEFFASAMSSGWPARSLACSNFCCSCTSSDDADVPSAISNFVITVALVNPDEPLAELEHLLFNKSFAHIYYLLWQGKGVFYLFFPLAELTTVTLRRHNSKCISCSIACAMPWVR